MPSNCLILCYPFSFCPQSFPASGSFPMSQIFCIRWLKYWRFNLSISPSNEYSGLISFRIDWFDLLAVQRILRIFSNTTVQKHQFFGAQPSLLSNSHHYMTTRKTITLTIWTLRPSVILWLESLVSVYIIKRINLVEPRRSGLSGKVSWRRSI